MLKPKTSPSNQSVLVNCHFDSAIGSPGASDDLASCTVMLEILFILSQSETSTIRHNLIFLFNGAEENYLQASHGFITQHRWRSTVRVFVNLEGAGSGGREFLFQAGPFDLWMLHAYLNNAPRPHGTVMAQEIFESGIVLSDTDYRIFRDYGKLSGMDMAFVKNGYLYHTEFDNAEHMPPGSLQHMGDNLLATLKTLANSECVTSHCPHMMGKLIFFDLLGVYVIKYSLKMGVVLNISVVVLIFFKIYAQFRCNDSYRLAVNKDKLGLVETGYSYQQFGKQLIVHMISIISIIVATVLTIVYIGFMNLTLFWYNQPELLLPTYIAFPVFIGLLVHVYAAERNVIQSNDDMQREQLSFDASLTITSFILLILTTFGLGSSFFVFVMLVLPVFRDAIFTVLCKLGVDQRNTFVLYGCRLIINLPGSIIGYYTLMEITSILLPMMGRSCSQVNPEFVAAGICCTVAIVAVLIQASLIYITENRMRLVCLLSATVVLALALLSLTSFRQPFSFDLQAPRWRRVMVQHIRRRVNFNNGSEMLKENGLWMLMLDYRGVGDLPKEIFLENATVPYCLPDEYFCGLPFYIPVRHLLSPEKTLWHSVPEEPTLSKYVNLKLLSKKQINSNKIVYSFSVYGHDHISLTVTALNQWTFDSWSLTNLSFKNRKTNFAYLANVDVQEPWEFTVTIQKNSYEDKTQKLLIGVGSHQIHGKHQYSERMQKLVDKVQQNRKKPFVAKDDWKWAMTIDGWAVDYLSQYFN